MKQQLEKPKKASVSKAKPAPYVPAAQRGLGEHVPELAALEESKRVTGATVRIPLDAIDVPGSLEARPVDWERVGQLAMSLRAEGQQIPIVVKPRGPRFELVDGRHRFLAARKLNWRDLSGQIREDLDGVGLAAARTSVNVARRVVSPYEEALGFQEMLDAGLTVGQIAERVGLSAKTVQERLKLAGLPPKVGVHVGDRLTIEDALEAFVPLVGHPQLMAAVEDLAAEGAGEWDVRDRLRQKGLVAKRPNDWYVAERLERGNLAKKVQELPHVKVGRETLVLDAAKYGELVQEAERAEAKNKGAASSANERRVGDEQRRRMAIDRQVRRIGVELLAGHLKSRTSFGDALQRSVYKAWLARIGNPRISKLERAALREIFGDALGKNDQDLDYARDEFVDRWWKKDRLALDRYVAAMTWLHEREAFEPQWVVEDDELSRLATGKTAKELQAEARKAAQANKKRGKAKAAKGAPPKPARPADPGDASADLDAEDLDEGEDA